MSQAAAGPGFIKLFGPLLDTLRELGDSGRPKEITERMASRLRLSADELNRTNKNGQSHFANAVAWSRFYLAKDGLIDTSRRGVWALTERGRLAKPDHAEALRIFQRIARIFQRRPTGGDNEEEHTPPDESQDSGFHREMAKVLQSLSANGFERLCQRILRELGFEEVVVSGRSGDGGIDGHGTLRVNRLISDRVLFQCKKHAEQISPNYIREFRGSMNGRAERGIFLATSRFSAEAKREANRDGAVPIEMVDLDGLISLLIELRLGVRTAYAVDDEFFSEFMTSESLESGKTRKANR
jgi:restriction system protein